MPVTAKPWGFSLRRERLGVGPGVPGVREAPHPESQLNTYSSIVLEREKKVLKRRI